MTDELVTRQEGEQIVVCNPETGEEWIKGEAEDLAQHR